MSNKVKAFQLAVGVDLIGSRMSVAAKHGTDLEATAVGIRMYSKTTKRIVVIPYSNVKGFELFLEEPANKQEPQAQEPAAEEPKKRGRQPKQPQV